MGHEPLTKWVVLGVVLSQLVTAVLLRHTRPLSPLFVVTAYAIGGTLNHNLFLAIHEITHNLAFKGIAANKALAVFANLPIGIPYCAMFKVRPLSTLIYRSSSVLLEISLGTPQADGRRRCRHRPPDASGASRAEQRSRQGLLCVSEHHRSAKRLLTRRRTFQILFYALRPGFVRSQRLTQWHYMNILTQIVFDVILVKAFGIRPLIYLLASSFFAGSLHPCAGHFIAEHYLWDGLEQETYSYYGPLNILAYNVCPRSSLQPRPPSYIAAGGLP